MIKQIYYNLKIISRLKKEIKKRMPEFGKIKIRYTLTFFIDNKDRTEWTSFNLGVLKNRKIDTKDEVEKILDHIYTQNDKELYSEYESNEKIKDRDQKINELLK